MSRTITRFTIKAIAGTGFLAAALALIPDAQAAPFKTGGYDCVVDSAGIAQSAGAVDGAPAGAPIAGAPAAAATPACGPVNDMSGVPMAFPGPVVPAGIVPVVPPVPVGVPPVPVGVPPVPVGVPPVPVGVPPVPVGVPPVPVGGALPVAAPVAAAAGALPGPAGLPIADMSGLGGKGVSTGPAPAGAPVSGQPIVPGPAG